MPRPSLREGKAPYFEPDDPIRYSDFSLRIYLCMYPVARTAQ